MVYEVWVCSSDLFNEEKKQTICNDIRLFKQKIHKHRSQEIFSLQLIIYFVLLKIFFFFFNRTINFKKKKTIDILKDLYTEAVYWFSSQNVLLANRHSKGSWFHAYIFNVLRVTGGYPLWPLVTVLLSGFLKKQLFIQRLSL